jgi:hypothetical protein
MIPEVKIGIWGEWRDRWLQQLGAQPNAGNSRGAPTNVT